MKHYFAGTLDRAACRAAADDAPLLTEQEVVVDMVGRLDGERGEKGRLAGQLGITRIELSDILAGRAAMRPGVASALGFRKVVRFERIE